MADEEAAFVVEQQLAELGRDRRVGAQTFGGADQDRLRCPFVFDRLLAMAGAAARGVGLPLLPALMFERDLP